MPASHDPDPSRAVPVEDSADATRRTHLANERTYLAWWRTGLAALAVSIGAGRLVPALTDSPHWPYTIVGIGFAILGVAFIAFAGVRHRQVEQAVSRGEFAPPDTRVFLGMATLGILVGLIVLGIVIAES